MNRVERPENTMAKMIEFRCARGKFFATFVEDQSSKNREEMRRTGIVRRLL